MKHLLFVSYYFPPQPEAGAVRTGAIATLLSEFGWRPTVISLAGFPPPHFVGDSVAARNVLVASVQPVPPTGTGPRAVSFRRRIPAPLRRAYWGLTQCYFPDAAMGWIPTALIAGLRAGAVCRFDAVLSSAHPPSAHLVASVLARHWRVPWLADYRDLWTGYPNSRKSAKRRWIEERLERAAVGQADVITTVSPALAEKLQKLFPARPVIVIPNGVELHEACDVNPSPPQTFRFLYAGRLYHGRRNPELVFAAVRRLRDIGEPAGEAIHFDFYGGEEEVVRQLAIRYGIEDAVTTHGSVDRRIILTEERRAAVLLILLSFDADTAQEYGSKIFEYVAARRPVLAVGPTGSVLRDYLACSGLGDFVDDLPSCSRAIKDAYERYRRGQYEPQLADGWSPFSTRDLARCFAETLDGLTEGSSL